jgi:hypothetical protein
MDAESINIDIYNLDVMFPKNRFEYIPELYGPDEDPDEDPDDTLKILSFDQMLKMTNSIESDWIFKIVDQYIHSEVENE